ncbi:hypothetical protein WMY93_016321 [Mugilogobius chulae]|uniref:Uncharacterized protein n=1 Tax=Mugilogobius chulae TaxID=88201 RepID=A0AAW0P2P4_9GOBI
MRLTLIERTAKFILFHSEVYDSHNGVYDSHNGVYDSHNGVYDSHGEVYDSHGEVYDSNGEVYNSHNEVYDSHSEVYDSNVHGVCDGTALSAPLTYTHTALMTRWSHSFSHASVPEVTKVKVHRLSRNIPDNGFY